MGGEVGGWEIGRIGMFTGEMEEDILAASILRLYLGAVAESIAPHGGVAKAEPRGRLLLIDGKLLPGLGPRPRPASREDVN